MSKQIREHTRGCDCFYRYGGDEFVIVAPATDLKGALTLGEKLRVQIEADALAEGLPLTVTVGVAVVHADETVATLMRRVDDALFSGKRRGRNCVHVAD